jgi:hypothetical protein
MSLISVGYPIHTFIYTTDLAESRKVLQLKAFTHFNNLHITLRFTFILMNLLSLKTLY